VAEGRGDDRAGLAAPEIAERRAGQHVVEAVAVQVAGAGDRPASLSPS
jgi:hypothetical protein